MTLGRPDQMQAFFADALGHADNRPAYIGSRIARSVDSRLLTGGGQYIADLRLPGMLDIAVVRSPIPHGQVAAIRTDGALDLDGVRAVVTAADLVDVSPYPEFLTHVRSVNYFPLARERVRYVGAPVAVVVADDRYLAEDGVELVEVDYDELPAVVSVEQAQAADATRLYADWPDNRLVDVIVTDAVVDEILRTGRVVHGKYSIQRHTGVPIETRGCVAEFRNGRLTLWSTNQHPHMLRTTLAYMLPLRERDIHVIAPDVGGAFGVKQSFYPEDVLVSWLAIRLGRPVRFIEDRSEHFVATTHAREETIEIEGAVRDDGTIEALRIKVVHDVGAAQVFPPASRRHL